MFEYLIGTLADAAPEKVVIDIDGIGYRVWVPLSTYEQLPQTGQECKVYTSVVVREDSQKIYGFLTQLERDFFDSLNEISGIGPRISLALLGHLPLEDFLTAIEHSNVKAITKVPGVGKKMAERLILELKDKKHKVDSSKVSLPKVGSVVGDAISALVNLGYPAIEAQKTVQKVADSHDDELPLSDLIALSLKK